MIVWNLELRVRGLLAVAEVGGEEWWLYAL
jgi:hypothetical protein